MLEPADHEAARLWIGRARMLGSKIDVAGLVGGDADLDIEARPALGRDLLLQGVADFVLGLRAEFDRHQLLGARTQAPADVVARDDEIGVGTVRRSRDLVSAIATGLDDCAITTVRRIHT